MAIRQFFTSPNFERNSSIFYTNCRSLGSNLSLNQSPRKLSDITVISIATPGTTILNVTDLYFIPIDVVWGLIYLLAHLQEN